MAIKSIIFSLSLNSLVQTFFSVQEELRHRLTHLYPLEWLNLCPIDARTTAHRGQLPLSEALNRSLQY